MTDHHIPLGLPQPDTDDWGYVLDSPALTVTYGPGPWPFHKVTTRVAAHRAGTANPTAVRLSPDFACHAWGPEYVILTPLPDGTVHARFRIHPAGATAAHHDHTTYTATLDPRRHLIHVNDHIPPPLRALAEAKTTRIQAFLLNALRERDNGTTRPRTATDYEAARRTPQPGT